MRREPSISSMGPWVLAEIATRADSNIPLWANSPNGLVDGYPCARDQQMNRRVPPSYHLRYGERRENYPVADFKLLKDVMEVHLDGAAGNIQPAPNFLF